MCYKSIRKHLMRQQKHIIYNQILVKQILSYSTAKLDIRIIVTYLSYSTPY